MDYAYEIRRQAEAAPRDALPAVASALWKAFGEGHVSEAEAEALSGLIEARQAEAGTHAPKPFGALRSRAGSRPRTDASMARRRRWAASGRLPPGIAARFTLAEQAALAVVAVEVAKRGDCRLALDHIAALAGVSRATVRNAIRQAKMLALVTVEERRQSRFRNDTNVVCVVSREWTAWLRLARKGVTFRDPLGEKGVADHHPIDGRAKKNLGRQGERGAAPRQLGGGRKSVTGTNTHVPLSVKTEDRRLQKGIRGGKVEGRPSPANRRG
ncbi:helix-turn-helix domain-containing protein [Methylobacterium sp. J-059]|uniref:helix-turn-helix domain-containing protein n=1 Tax=Methylobacterium sp. J-059 TaxID=2836643 RepID=UPI001FBA1AAD|nr:helix-turn-helix domain-containing protein [Methylobacterium sp. J-059]MCJ2039544.1 helix-turn-helix domain-containing protein [Methylobacterium sp. J-059]